MDRRALRGAGLSHCRLRSVECDISADGTGEGRTGGNVDDGNYSLDTIALLELNVFVVVVRHCRLEVVGVIETLGMKLLVEVVG